MLENILFSVNAVLPIFLLVFLGWCLKKTNFLPDEFYPGSEKFVFKIALPVMLFSDIATSSVENLSDNLSLVMLCSVGVVVIFILLCLVTPIFIKEKDKRGAFIQGAYRSNFGILGMPLARNLFGQEGSVAAALLMPAAIILFNILAVVILTACAPEDVKKKPSVFLRDLLLSIIKNPLIIACVLAIPFLAFGITLPAFAAKTLDNISGTVSALALISLGAGFNKEAFRGRVGYSVVSSALKTIVLPVGMVAIGYLLGFRGAPLGLVFILFGSPTAVSSYIMAKNMKSDYEMAGQILLLSTLMCLFTLFIGIFLLKTLSLI